MLFETTDVHVRERAAQLGCLVPDAIAIMPENFFSAPSRHEFRVRTESVTRRALFEDGGCPLGSFVPVGEHAVFCHDSVAHWEASLFVPGSKRPAINTALALISRHLAEFFRGPSAVTVRLSLVVELFADGLCWKFTYSGSVAGIMSFAERIREAA
jgi:hypothetical protein